MNNLAFHSLLRWKLIILPILTTSVIHFSSKGWENVLCELRSERVKPVVLTVLLLNQTQKTHPAFSEKNDFALEFPTLTCLHQFGHHPADANLPPAWLSSIGYLAVTKPGAETLLVRQKWQVWRNLVPGPFGARGKALGTRLKAVGRKSTVFVKAAPLYCEFSRSYVFGGKSLIPSDGSFFVRFSNTPRFQAPAHFTHNRLFVTSLMFYPSPSLSRGKHKQ